MHLRRTLQIASCSLLGLLPVAGCQRSSTPSGEETGPPVAGAVAVIDLDGVARQLGSDAQMADAIAEREAALNQQLQVVQAAYQDQLSEKQLEFGSGASPEQTHQLAQMQRQAYANLNQARDEAEDDLRRFRLQLINRFRDEVKPVARAVAAEKGLSIVVTKNESFVFTYESSADITAEVAAQMLGRAAGGGGAAAAEVSRGPAAGHARR